MTDQIQALITANVHHARKAKALRLAEVFAAEYTALKLTPLNADGERGVEGEDERPISGFVVDHSDEFGTLTEVLKTTDGKAPELADVLEACADADLDPEGEEEEKSSGSIVKEHYRKLYKESSSNNQTCGDWLAEFLTSECWSVADGFNPDAFMTVLTNNEIDQSRPWAQLYQSGQPGWVGRWRMNGRQAIEKQIAWTGFIIDANGAKHDIPEGPLADLQSKHAKWIAKQEKMEAALKQDETPAEA